MEIVHQTPVATILFLSKTLSLSNLRYIDRNLKQFITLDVLIRLEMSRLENFVDCIPTKVIYNVCKVNLVQFLS